MILWRDTGEALAPLTSDGPSAWRWRMTTTERAMMTPGFGIGAEERLAEWAQAAPGRRIQIWRSVETRTPIIEGVGSPPPRLGLFTPMRMTWR